MLRSTDSVLRFLNAPLLGVYFDADLTFLPLRDCTHNQFYPACAARLIAFAAMFSEVAPFQVTTRKMVLVVETHTGYVT